MRSLIAAFKKKDEESFQHSNLNSDEIVAALEPFGTLNVYSIDSLFDGKIYWIARLKITVKGSASFEISSGELRTHKKMIDALRALHENVKAFPTNPLLIEK